MASSLRRPPHSVDESTQTVGAAGEGAPSGARLVAGAPGGADERGAELRELDRTWSEQSHPRPARESRAGAQGRAGAGIQLLVADARRGRATEGHPGCCRKGRRGAAAGNLPVSEGERVLERTPSDGFRKRSGWLSRERCCVIGEEVKALAIPRRYPHCGFRKFGNSVRREEIRRSGQDLPASVLERGKRSAGLYPAIRSAMGLKVFLSDAIPMRSPSGRRVNRSRYEDKWCQGDADGLDELHASGCSSSVHPVTNRSSLDLCNIPV